MAKTRQVQLSQLVDMSDPHAVLEEVKYNFIHHYHIADFFQIRASFRDFLDFYEGKFPGYRACNTKFHDKTHVTDAVLAMSRLIDGYNIKNPKLPVKLVIIAILASIFHDSGYVQADDDTKGTGAKYTLEHVERSADFIKKYFKRIGFSEKEALSARKMIFCTGVTSEIVKIEFDKKEEKILGFMLGSSDLLGQMASRNYLEKLIFLYSEFKEGHVEGYSSELSLLKDTLNFYSDTKKKLSSLLGGVNKHASVHFKKRYKLDADMYHIAVEAQMDYLEKILKNIKKPVKDMLKRKL
ncbi:hypothetical protein ACFL58_04355 [Elusimicrobiota bacterium]